MPRLRNRPGRAATPESDRLHTLWNAEASMVRHLGLSIGENWTLTRLGSADRRPDQVAASLDLRLTGDSTWTSEELLKTTNLEAATVVCLGDAYSVTAGLRTEVLPGAGTGDKRVLRAPWSELSRGCDPAVLLHCLKGFLQAILARMEEDAGLILLPCDSFTVAIPGDWPLAFHTALAKAISEVLKVEPVMLWRPVACAGWVVGAGEGTRALFGGQTLRVVPDDSQLPGISLWQERRKLHSEIGACRVALPAHPLALHGKDAGGDAAAALGAAMWGWWRQVAGVDQNDRTSLRPLLVGAAGAEPSLSLLDVTPDQSVGTSPRWFARSLEVSGQLYGPVRIDLCADFGWGGHRPLIHQHLLGSDEMQRSGKRTAVVVKVPADAALEAWLVRSAAPPVLLCRQPRLSGAAEVPADDPHDPLPDAVASMFRSAFAPAPRRYHWVPNVSLDALFPLDDPSAIIPRVHGKACPFDVLDFSGVKRKLLGRKIAGGGIVKDSHVTSLAPNLRRHRIAISLPRGTDLVEWEFSAPADSKQVLRWRRRLADEAFGLQVELSWDRESVTAAPFPVGREVDGNGGMIPQATGVQVGNGTVHLSLPAQGRLLLANRGALRLVVQLQAPQELRLSHQQVELGAGASITLPVQFRDMLEPAWLSRSPTGLLRLTVVPLEAGAPETVITVPLELPVRAGTGGAVCLPLHDPMSLQLRIGAPEFELPVHVAGDSKADVVLEPEDGECTLAGIILPGSDVIRVNAPVARLLEWFSGPLERVTGTLRIRHTQPSGDLVVPYPFTASLTGIVCENRQIKVTAPAGKAFDVPCPVLVAGLDPSELRAEWKSGADTPGKMKCEMVEHAENDPAFAVEVQQKCNDSVIRANESKRLQVTVRVAPQSPCGWEDNLCQGRLRLLDAQGTPLDEMLVDYQPMPARPRVGVALRHDSGRLLVELAVVNSNPYRPLVLESVELTVGVRILGVGMADTNIVFDEPSRPGQRVEAGESRTWRGQFRPPPLLARMALKLARSARMQFKMVASCQGRQSAPTHFACGGLVAIGG